MPRANVITRTISATECVALCVDVESGKSFEKKILLPKVYKDEHKMYKDCKKIGDDVTTKVVVIKSHSVVQSKYGMSVEKFIENAEII